MKLTRRKFLVGTGIVGGGLILGVSLSNKPPVPGKLEGGFSPNAWLQIMPDGRALFIVDRTEMGQGVFSSLPTLLAEELDFDPARFELLNAGVHPDFANPLILYDQSTGGSTSVAGRWQPLREAGAAARAMLVAAAASRWGIDGAQCRTDNGVISNTVNSETLTYAQVCEAANGFTDAPYQLKTPDQYKYIGKSMPRLDARDKSTGKAVFGVDVVLPNQKTAVIVRSPYFGGSVKSWSRDSVINQPGILDAFAVNTGIAIVAEGYWPARKAADGLQVEWDKGPVAGLNDAAILAGQRDAMANGEAHVDDEAGDVNTARSANLLSAEYRQPFLNHSPMEPMNATALYITDANGDRCEVWTGNQAPKITRTVVAEAVGIDRNNVTIHTPQLGGGFGRRGFPDFASEAAVVAKHFPDTPVKVQWSREDEMQHDYYRPASLHAIEGSLDDEGNIVHWQHKFVVASGLKGLASVLMVNALPAWVPIEFARSVGNFIGDQVQEYDPSLAEGAKNNYRFPVEHISHVVYDPGVPKGFWRSVGYSNNVFVTESFMDEMAAAAKRDPLEFRLHYLAPGSREANVLKLVADKSAWGQPAAGRFQGVAISQPFYTHCATVAEVEVKGNQYSVKRVVVAVDCGQVISPDIAVTQIESAVIYALTATMKTPVSIEDARVKQSNFHDLPVLRINEVPDIEVHLVDSHEEPTGLGEIGVPNVAPAVANALFAATGQRLRQLPLVLS